MITVVTVITVIAVFTGFAVIAVFTAIATGRIGHDDLRLGNGIPSVGNLVAAANRVEMVGFREYHALHRCVGWFSNALAIVAWSFI